MAERKSVRMWIAWHHSESRPAAITLRNELGTALDVARPLGFTTEDIVRVELRRVPATKRKAKKGSRRAK